ncbi:uncharacterized protein LOC118756774 [Rhagoletis pomonella]|uniref:uncharacterized protein LOC118756774 n=1 Tax=Rhagoletis pomonella TaxID=28610 RepID=UPI0017822312|nr:uncharacterized protein LOC118756774 [Rhagoletis pomonella]
MSENSSSKMEDSSSMECENRHEGEKGIEAPLQETEKCVKENNESVIRTVLYPANFNGEIFVLVDSSECPILKNYRVTTGLTLFSQIKDLRHIDIDYIFSLGRSLYKITFKNTYAANNFVLDDKLCKRGLKPFIPNTALEMYGVIRGVPLCFSETDFIKEAKSSIPIRSAKRFMRKDPTTNELTPTTTLKVGFYGNEIPKTVVYEYTKLNVDFYIPPLRQCKKCGRLGHTMMSCKSKARCLKCGNSECSSECNINKCILCGNEGHTSIDKLSCPYWEKEMTVNRIKTVKKMSRKEVLNTYYPNNNNRFSIFEQDDESFPPVCDSIDETVDKNVNINRNLAKRSYRDVVKKRNFYQEPSPVRYVKKTKNNAISNPAINSPSYQKGIVTRMERLMSQLLKITQRISIEFSDNKTFKEIQILKTQFDQIMNKKDEREIIDYSHSIFEHENTPI